MKGTADTPITDLPGRLAAPHVEGHCGTDGLLLGDAAEAFKGEVSQCLQLNVQVVREDFRGRLACGNPERDL